jgi:hypothetical protein
MEQGLAQPRLPWPATPHLGESGRGDKNIVPCQDRGLQRYPLRSIVSLESNEPPASSTIALAFDSSRAVPVQTLAVPRP